MVRHYRPTKSLWKSKTLWFNSVLLVLVLIGAIPAVLTPVVLIGVLVMNCLLRVATSQAISVDGQPRLSKSRMPFIVRSSTAWMPRPTEAQAPKAIWNGQQWVKDEGQGDG